MWWVSSGQILLYDLGPAKERAAKREKASVNGSAEESSGKEEAHKRYKFSKVSSIVFMDLENRR